MPFAVFLPEQAAQPLRGLLPKGVELHGWNACGLGEFGDVVRFAVCQYGEQMG